MPYQRRTRRLSAALPGWLDEPDPSAKRVVGVAPGEGVGHEVLAAARDVLEAVSDKFATPFELRYAGNTASSSPPHAQPTEDAVALCDEVFTEQGAVLCGPRSGRFVYELRSHFDLFCKFTPVRPYAALADAGVLKPHIVDNVDIVLVRENAGGVYFGEESVVSDGRGIKAVEHRFRYTSDEVERIADVAVRLAAARSARLSVIVKPGGLEALSTLWADVCERRAGEAGVSLTVLAVDNAAYQLIAEPSGFDVVVSPNMLGDILADHAGLLLGSRGMTFSGNFGPRGAVYQTGHGAAYALAGQDVANPLGQIGALAMMLSESFGLTAAADAVVRATEEVLASGWRTADIAGPGCRVIGTREMGARVSEAVLRREDDVAA